MPSRSDLPAITATVIAVTVAIAQLISAKTGTLTPWKGGGFGMFATNDNPIYRSLHITAIDSSGRTFKVVLRGSRGVLDLPPNFLTIVTAEPTLPRLIRVAEAILTAPLAEAWRDPFELTRRQTSSVRYADVLRTARPREGILEIVRPGEPGRRKIRTVSVQTVRLRFDQTAARVTVEPFGPLGQATSAPSGVSKTCEGTGC